MQVRLTAMAAPGNPYPMYSEAIEVLRIGCADIHALVRLNSVRSIRKMGPNPWLPVDLLESLLDDPTFETRLEAAYALSRTVPGNQRVVAALIQILQKKPLSYELCVDALRFNGINAQQAVPFLQSLIAGDNTDAAKQARNALKHITREEKK